MNFHLSSFRPHPHDHAHFNNHFDSYRPDQNYTVENTPRNIRNNNNDDGDDNDNRNFRQQQGMTD